MVFFNYATMQMAAKIVYYGPGLCGKTTNLHHIYAKTSPQSRGEMVSLETETDRTLFFDLLPIDVGVIGGFKTRLQLYTIPGQVFYNTTRKLVLKGVDGLVFVADSQVAMLEANVDSLKNLRENLGEIGLTLEEIPLVLQLNKRDLPNINPVDTILDALDPGRNYEYTEAIAATGVGVFETLKLISKLTLRTLRRRMTGDEPVRQPARKGLSDMTQFRVKDDGPGGARPSAPSLNTNAVGTPVPATPQPFGGAAPAPAASGAGTTVAEPPDLLDDVEEVGASDELRNELNEEMESSAEPREAPQAPPSPPAPEPEIEFNEAAKPKPAPPVKHVKVRSSIDVMAELEALRKKATQSPAKQKKEGGGAAPARRGRELHKAAQVNVPAEALNKARSLKVTLSFEDGENNVVQVQEEKVELGETSDVQSVSLNVRIDSE
jgi:signal recognition particle receptor subunit beta